MMSALSKFKNEAEFIGRLITTYAELEYDLCLCVASGIDNLDSAVKALYRARGETQRVEVADALGRHAFHRLKLGTQFEEVIAGMRVCLKVRNQYAHAYFHDDLSSTLCFLNLEEIAKENPEITDFNKLTFKYLDMAVLVEQRDFFVYVDSLLLFVNMGGQAAHGRMNKNPVTAPAKVNLPRMYK